MEEPRFAIWSEFEFYIVRVLNLWGGGFRRLGAKWGSGVVALTRQTLTASSSLFFLVCVENLPGGAVVLQREQSVDCSSGHYEATERDRRSVAMLRPNVARARSLRSDRAGRVLGRYVAIELGSSSVAT
ncbi:hypothetical protein F2Q68_00035217 [Brassica cretica]|uniref:Uncharacterized protein n=1 Tax=Brassica cretica TaxID=69181 RepID=A0A8S9H4R6_BRACR|nr:hypothetical protein F2Q68_00035217 [Brassica cretica]